MLKKKKLIYKETILATEKQKDYLRSLLLQLGLYSRADSEYKALPIWRAAKMITKLKAQAEALRKQDLIDAKLRRKEKISFVGNQVPMRF